MSATATDLYCEPCMFMKLEYVKAKTFCEGCRERYCQLCLLDHSKFRVLRSHPVVSLVQSETKDNEDSGEYFAPIVKRTDNEDSGDNLEPRVKPTDNEDSGEYLAPIVKRTDNEDSDDNLEPIVHLTDKEDSGDYIVPIFATTDNEDSDDNLVQTVPESNDIPYNVDHETASEECSDSRSDSYYKTETEKEPSTQESQSFQVEVVNTDLVRRIKDIGKRDLKNKKITFTINEQGIGLILRGIQVFYCEFSAVRRFHLSRERGIFCAEIGRRCITGEGELKLKSKGASDILEYCLEQLARINQ